MSAEQFYSWPLSICPTVGKQAGSGIQTRSLMRM